MPSVREESASLWQREQWWNDFRSHSWDGLNHTLRHNRKQGNNQTAANLGITSATGRQNLTIS